LIPRWPGAWVEDKGLSATLHYRNVDTPLTSSLLFSVRRRLSEFSGSFAYRAGKKAFEIRPKVGWDKGSALQYIQERTGPFDLCICIGDDRTDESMFRANPGGINVRVGCGRPTAAPFYVTDPAETGNFLDHVAASRAGAVGSGLRFSSSF
jgi:trehalose 6-phosphate phosphatase